ALFRVLLEFLDPVSQLAYFVALDDLFDSLEILVQVVLVRVRWDVGRWRRAFVFGLPRLLQADLRGAGVIDYQAALKQRPEVDVRVGVPNVDRLACRARRGILPRAQVHDPQLRPKDAEGDVVDFRFAAVAGVSLGRRCKLVSEHAVN